MPEVGTLLEYTMSDGSSLRVIYTAGNPYNFGEMTIDGEVRRVTVNVETEEYSITDQGIELDRITIEVWSLTMVSVDEHEIYYYSGGEDMGTLNEGFFNSTKFILPDHKDFEEVDIIDIKVTENYEGTFDWADPEWKEFCTPSDDTFYEIEELSLRFDAATRMGEWVTNGITVPVRLEFDPWLHHAMIYDVSGETENLIFYGTGYLEDGVLKIVYIRTNMIYGDTITEVSLFKRSGSAAAGNCTHQPEIDAAVAATCNGTGLTEGSHCALCGVVLTAQQKTPPTYAHKFVEASGANPYKCSQCGLGVISHGNADGSISGGNNKVKYYVRGDLYNYQNFSIVVYGSGDMPDFAKDDQPMWQEYLHHAVSITVADGITSIGKYAFYCPDATVSCKLEMADTVKTVKSYAIHVNVGNLVLGKGVETVEQWGFGDIDSIYIPRSLKKLCIDVLGNETYYYEGTLEEFYKIQLYAYNRYVSIGEQLATYDEFILARVYVYLEADSITDRSHYWK